MDGSSVENDVTSTSGSLAPEDDYSAFGDREVVENAAGEDGMDDDVHGERTTLSLCDSFLGDDGCLSIVNKYRASECLVRVDLRGCHIGQKGTEAIADLLRVNRSIQFLSLEWNQIGCFDGSFRALAASLEINQSLVELDLRNNRIGPAGGVSLGRSLASNIGLKILDLRWNELGTSGGRALAQCLEQSNRTLHSLKASGNNMLAEHINTIEECLERNRHPDSNILAAQAHLSNMAAHLRINSPSTSHRPQKKPTSEIIKEQRHQESKTDREDHLVFAENVVELEIQLKQMDDQIANLEKERVAEMDRADKAEKIVLDTKTELDQAVKSGQEMKQSINVLESDLRLARDELSRSKTHLHDMEDTIEKLSAQVDELEEVKNAAERELEREKSIRKSLEQSIEKLRSEKNDLKTSLKTQQDENTLHREEIMRKEINHDNELLQREEEFKTRLDELDAKFAKEVRDRGEERRIHLEEIQKIQKQHQRDLLTQQETHEQAIQDLHAKYKSLMEEEESKLDKLQVEHRLELKKLAEKHEQLLKTKTKRIEESHAERHAKEVELAVEQAVEQALDLAVREQVEKAVKEMEADHKRVLWKREKEIMSKAKEEAQQEIDIHLEEKTHLEEQLARLKAKLAEMESQHKKQLGVLQERLTMSISEAFTS